MTNLGPSGGAKAPPGPLLGCAYENCTLSGALFTTVRLMNTLTFIIFLISRFWLIQGGCKCKLLKIAHVSNVCKSCSHHTICYTGCPRLGDFEKCGKFHKFFKPFLKLILPKENYSLLLSFFSWLYFNARRLHNCK